jgi:hypothetical protein
MAPKWLGIPLATAIALLTLCLGFGSCGDSTNTPDPNQEEPAAAALPILISPAQGENTGADRTPLFRWRPVAEAYSYEIQADDSPDFSSVNYAWADLGGTRFRPSVAMAASGSAPVGTRYYLRIRMIDGDGLPGEWNGTAGAELRYVNVGRRDKDLNGDGYSDLFAAANGDSFRGSAFIYYGGASFNTTADLTLSEGSASIYNYFGDRASLDGDLNGDGYADVLVGATGLQSAYVYFGGPSMDAVADLTLTGGYNFGDSVAIVGDLNGDGFDEAAVSQRGTVRVYFGGASMDSTEDLTLNCSEDDGNGRDAASAGDANGDGYPDVIVGATGPYDGNGRAYLYYGGPSLDGKADLAINCKGDGWLYGGNVASGDLNGDGYSDAIISATSYDGSRGRVLVYYGGIQPSTEADISIAGEYAEDSFGSSISSGGDLNGDGCDDLIVGTNYYTGGSDTGKAWIYFGGAAMDSSADLSLTGASSLIEMGYDVALGGDVNGDGYADAIIGERGYNGNKGSVLILLGGAGMNATTDYSMTAASSLTYFGKCVE